MLYFTRLPRDSDTSTSERLMEKENKDTSIEEEEQNKCRFDTSQLPQASNPCNEPQLVRVNRVVDGDTIYVQMGTREENELIGINAPEIGYSGESSECFAEEAQQYLESLVDGKQLAAHF